MENPNQDLEIEVPTQAKPKSIYDLFETDTTMEEQGIVLDFGVYGCFKIARAGGANQKFAECFTRRSRPYAKQQRSGTLPEEIAKRLLVEIYTETIIKGWDGVIGRDGKPIPFTPENCKKLMLALPDLFADIRAASSDLALYKQEQAEEVAGN